MNLQDEVVRNKTYIQSKEGLCEYSRRKAPNSSLNGKPTSANFY
jgi:hypothetical protein